MKTQNDDRILARIVARELTVDELEGASGGGFKQVDLPGANNSSSVTTCSHNIGLMGNHADGGADD
jgi:hypothetical protein